MTKKRLRNEASYQLINIYVEPVMNKLMHLATNKANFTGKRLPQIPDLPNLKKLHPSLENKTATYIVSHHIRAVTIQNTKSTYPIVVYVDMNNENIIAIFYEYSDTAKRYTIAKPTTPIASDNGLIRTQNLLEIISNGLLPNMSSKATDELITALIDYGFGSDMYISDKIYNYILSVDKDLSGGRVTLEFLHPRHTDDTIGILKDLFNRYKVEEEIPTDLFHSQDKTWVYKGHSKDHPNTYIEIELRQAQRSIDRGHEFRVIAPGYKRRIFDVDTICYK